MQRMGLSHPSSVQALASKPILQGRNVVLAAETGSGKTLAYLLPIMQQLRHETLLGRSTAQQGAVVLCPNTALCNQVVCVANSLESDDGSKLVKAVRIASSSPPPTEVPQIMVCTPAGLINATREFKDNYGPAWSQNGIVQRARWVVVDEADLLMTGGYARDTRKILQSMRLADRTEKIEQVCQATGITFEEFQELPRLSRTEALAGNLKAIHAAAQQRKANHVETDALGENEALDWGLRAAESSAEGRSESSETANTSHVGERPTDGQDASPALELSRTGDGMRARQYIFVAATMPQDSKKSAGSDITKICPDAVWLSGRQLHQSVQNTRHVWREVNEESWSTALQEAIRASEGGKTLVFAATVAGAESTAEALREAGITPLVYHRNLTRTENDIVLAQASSREDCVIVSTDAAARGVDLPNIKHVIQADFSASAIDFLHRVGRTGRAGNTGKVTSLYDESSKVLAEAIRDAVERKEPIEGAFSRNRSFRNKYKKYGRYVPRGQAA